MNSIQTIDQNKVNEILDKFGLNWTVSKDPLISETYKTRTPFFGLVRDDTKEYYQSVSKEYTPLQNHELVGLGLKIAEETGGEIGTIRTVKKSGLIYLPIHSQNLDIEYKNKEGRKVGDKVGENIILYNSHNGSRSFGMTYSHVVLSCTNGMTRSDKIGTFTIRHTSNMMAKFKQAMNYHGSILKHSNQMFDSYKTLIDKPIDSDQVLELFDIMLDPFEKEKHLTEYSTQTQNNIKNLTHSITKEVIKKGENAFGLLNGITHWTTGEADNSQSRLGSKLLGNLALKELKAYNFLMAN